MKLKLLALAFLVSTAALAEPVKPAKAPSTASGEFTYTPTASAPQTSGTKSQPSGGTGGNGGKGGVGYVPNSEVFGATGAVTGATQKGTAGSTATKDTVTVNPISNSFTYTPTATAPKSTGVGAYGGTDNSVITATPPK